MNHPGKRSAQRGVTLVESLVALVVLSVGMLGIASLYISSLKAGRAALVRTQAVNLVAEISDRIRSNRTALNAYNLATYAGGPKVHPECLGGNCTPAVLAEDDLARWLTTLRFVMPGNAKGDVVFVDPAGDVPYRYTVTVSWRESGEAADSTAEAVVEL